MLEPILLLQRHVVVGQERWRVRRCRPGAHRLEDDDGAVRAEHALQLREDRAELALRIGGARMYGIADRPAGDDQVGTAVRERQFAVVGHRGPHARVREAGRLEPAARDVQHRGRGVQRDDGVCLRRELERQPAGAGAEVDDVEAVDRSDRLDDRQQAGLFGDELVVAVGLEAVDVGVIRFAVRLIVRCLTWHLVLPLSIMVVGDWPSLP